MNKSHMSNLIKISPHVWDVDFCTDDRQQTTEGRRQKDGRYSKKKYFCLLKRNEFPKTQQRFVSSII